MDIRISILLLMLLITPATAAPPFLEGRVTDEHGHPIEGATVYIADCIGTCLGGTGKLTDVHGKYVFPDRTFRNVPALSASMPGRYHVSTDYRGPTLLDSKSDQPRTADFVLGTPAAVTVKVKGNVPAGWNQKVLLRAGRDATVHRYDLSGVHSEGWDSWRFDLVPRSHSYHVVVVQQPKIETTDDRTELRKRKRQSAKQQIEIISRPIRFARPVRYTVQLQLNSPSEYNTRHLELVSVVDVLGEDRTDELASTAPLFGPPVSRHEQEQALELLKRVADAASPWNARPSSSIESYQYDAVDAGDNRTRIKITKDSPQGPAWSDIARMRGFAYMPPLRWLFNQGKNVVFYDVQINPQRAVLTYRLNEPRRYSIGIGVGPGWNGFFSRSFSSGKITIDTTRAVVLEHRLSAGLVDKETVETFGEYVAVDGGYAPRRLRLQSSGFDIRLQFKVHEDLLWLLDQATHGEQKQPAFRLENVSVDRSDGN